MSDFVEYLKTVDTPTLCNAIELLKVRPHEEGFTPLQVRCLFPELGRMIGLAVTATVETVTRMEARDNRTFVARFHARDGFNSRGHGEPNHAAQLREEATHLQRREPFLVRANFQQLDRIAERGRVHGLQVFDEIAHRQILTVLPAQ